MSIIIFYKYVPISNPNAIRSWQKSVCTRLQLKGRIILASEGINGCLGGSDESLQEYQGLMEQHPLFSNIDYKISPGNTDCFPKLKVMIRNEIVNLGLDPEVVKAQDAGMALSPVEVHELLSKKRDNLVILDCRNKCESDIGIFSGAIPSNTKYFRELPGYIDSNLDIFKDKDVLMYCTAGVRCERSTAYLKSKNVAKNVYHIRGGIQRYAEQFPDGFFRGKNYVFDGRLTVKVTDDILGSCLICQTPCDDYNNCMNAACNKHFICCSPCLNEYKSCCSKNCQTLVEEQKVPIRPTFKKIDMCSIMQD